MMFRTEPHEKFDGLLRLQTGTGGYYKDLLMFVWFGSTDMSSIDYGRKIVPSIKEKYGGFSCLILVSEGSVMPNRSQRKAFAKMWQDLEPRGVATYVEAPGFISTAVKSVMSVINSLSRTRDTFRVFNQLEGAAEWLSSRGEITCEEVISRAAALPRCPPE